jgi:prevent-host-death family protein
MTQRVQVAEARKDFAKMIARSARGIRMKITRYGRTLAGLVPKDDLEKLERYERAERDSGGSTVR